jgi:hypothetical protein
LIDELGNTYPSLEVTIFWKESDKLAANDYSTMFYKYMHMKNYEYQYNFKDRGEVKNGHKDTADAETYRTSYRALTINFKSYMHEELEFYAYGPINQDTDNNPDIWYEITDSTYIQNHNKEQNVGQQ